jgi:hypothetical protein
VYLEEDNEKLKINLRDLNYDFTKTKTRKLAKAAKDERRKTKRPKTSFGVLAWH